MAHLAARAALLALAACTGGQPSAGVSEPDGTDADRDGWSVEEGDCDDADPTVYPYASDPPYDGVDSDCSGDDDDDADGDGYPGGEGGTDCDDQRAAVYPGAVESCNGRDDDCDGEVDEDAAEARPVYADGDRDGYGVGEVLWSACTAVDGTSFTPGDCDDRDPTVNPGERELCDGVDNDCDGVIDNDPDDGNSRYPDDDGDGYGLDAGLTAFCDPPADWVLVGGDCDDGDPLSFPGAEELCDSLDNDCDGVADEGATEDRRWWRDADGDGHGGEDVAVTACARPDGYALLPDDCDDGDPSVFPGNEELCNGVDDDCDGGVDDEDPDGAPVDAGAWFPDADGDAFGSDDDRVFRCDAPAGWIATGGDCDDLDPGISPLAEEYCDGVDNDCDGAWDEPTAVGAVTWYSDGDGDGYGAGPAHTPACTAPAGFGVGSDDCDDANPAVWPGAPESCDGVDNDCNGAVDDDPIDGEARYPDADGDGYGAGEGTVSCASTGEGVTNDDDCDDTDALVSPAATEVDDGIDNDCDLAIDEDFVVVGDLVVSEVARQPYVGGSGTSSNAYAQWFEVANASARDVALSAFWITDQDGDGFYIHPDAAVVVPAGGYAAICYDDSVFLDPGDCAYVWGVSGREAPWADANYTFDRDEDFVSISVAGLELDRVRWTYDDAQGYWPRTAARSMELDDDALDPVLNDDKSVWCLASESDEWSSFPDYGTPGAANGSCD